MTNTITLTANELAAVMRMREQAGTVVAVVEQPTEETGKEKAKVFGKADSDKPLFLVEYTTKAGKTKPFGCCWHGEYRGNENYGLKRLDKNGLMIKGKPFFISVDKGKRLP